MNAFLYVNFVSGLGDTYSTIMSALECSMELEKMGYNPHLIINTTRNQYIPPNISLDCLFNFNDFKNPVIYNPSLDNDGNPIIYGFNLIKVPQRQISYLIYVDNISEKLDGYESYIFGHTEINRDDRRPICNTDIISEQVKLISENFLLTNDVITLHYRAMDGEGDSEEKLGLKKYFIDSLINENEGVNILICSNGKLVRDYVKNKYEKSITFEFTHDSLELYPCYDIYNQNVHSDYVFIRHSQEILAEMVSIKKSNKIISISPFLSNFVTYGILNNIHNKPYHEIFKYVH